MGLFGGKKQTYRDLSYARLITDDYLPNIMGQAVTTFVLDDKNEKSLADLMIEYGWKSNAVKWNTAYRWAAKPGKYYYGNPKAIIANKTDFTGTESLDTVLKNLSGQSQINYLYSKFGPINMRHAMWTLLSTQYNYDSTTNKINGLLNSLGVTPYLYAAQSFFTADVMARANPATLQHWGLSPTWGPTQNRPMDLSRADIPDATASGNANYTRVEYTFRFVGIKLTTVVTTTKVDTTVRTPNGAGGYTDKTTTTSSSTTASTRDWNGQTLPNASNIISQSETVTSNTTTTVSDPPTSTSTTNPTTGVITVVKTTVTRDTTVKVTSLDVVAFFNMSFGQYDYSATGLIDTSTVLNDADMGNYNPTAVLKPSGENVGGDDDYFQVLFTYVAGGVQKFTYFTYQFGSGNYPDLDGIADTTVTDFGQSYPRIYFRLDGNRLDAPQYVDSPAYKSSMKLSRKLDLNWLQVLEKIYESLSSLQKVRDVFLVQCVPANTTNTLEQQYLFNYFKTLYGLRPKLTDNQYDVKSIIGSQSDGKSTTKPVTDYDTWDAHSGTVIKATDARTSMYNNMDAIGYKTIQGSIGPLGTTASGLGTGVKLNVYSKTTTNDKNVPTTTIFYDTSPVTYHFYQYQSSLTSYEEVRVYELTHQVDVGGKGVSRSGGSTELMVQLDHAFRKQFSPHDREVLYARATHIFIGTEYTVKTKWYQTGLFRAVVIVVAVVLSWWTGGASMTLVGVVTAVATTVGAMVIMSLLSRYVFSKLGGAFAIIATVVAIAVAIYTGYLYFTSTTGPFSITATQMMQVSNVAFKAAQASQQGSIEAEFKKMARLEEEMNYKLDTLKTAQKELENPYNTIEDRVFLKAIDGYSYMGEKPLEFFSRTLNTNIGVETNDLVNMYYTQSLRLPSDVSINQLIMQNIDRPFELFNALNDQLNK